MAPTAASCLSVMGLARAGGSNKQLVVVGNLALHAKLPSRQLKEGHARCLGAIRKECTRSGGNRHINLGPGDHIETGVE